MRLKALTLVPLIFILSVSISACNGNRNSNSSTIVTNSNGVSIKTFVKNNTVYVKDENGQHKLAEDGLYIKTNDSYLRLKPGNEIRKSKGASYTLIRVKGTSVSIESRS